MWQSTPVRNPGTSGCTCMAYPSDRWRHGRTVVGVWSKTSVDFRLNSIYIACSRK
jgi:hypothetical protein